MSAEVEVLRVIVIVKTRREQGASYPFLSVAGAAATIKRGRTIQPIGNEELKANARRAYDERRLTAQQDLLDAVFATILKSTRPIDFPW